MRSATANINSVRSLVTVTYDSRHPPKKSRKSFWSIISPVLAGLTSSNTAAEA